MKKAFLFSYTALKFIAWVVIPFLIFACSTAKTVQNKQLLQRDTIIIHATDTIRQVRWQTRTDTLRERIYEHDSTSQRQEGDMTIREIWHWETKESDRSRTVVDSLAALVSKLESERQVSQRQETNREVRTESKEPPWYKRILYWAIILIVFVVIYKVRDKSIRS